MLPVIAPRQRQLGRRQPRLLGDLPVRRHGRLVLTAEVSLHKARKHIQPRLLRDLTRPVLASEDPAGQGGVRQEGDVVVVARLGHTGLVVLPANEGVAVLDRDDPGIKFGVRLGQVDHRADPERRLVAHADVPDLPRLDDLVQRRELLLERDGIVHIHGVEIRLPEQSAGVPVRPVELEEVDVVRPQPLEGRVHTLQDLLPRQFRRTFVLPQPRNPFGPSRDFGRKNDVLPLPPPHERSHRLICLPLGFGLGRYRVHLSRIEEVDAVLVPGQVQLLDALLDGVLLAEGHGPHAHLGDGQVRAPQLDVVHPVLQAGGRLVRRAAPRGGHGGEGGDIRCGCEGEREGGGADDHWFSFSLYCGWTGTTGNDE
mmetsp:Transcript_1312/g.3583  ORF Transcript_1312/g.3583 Transcript_1312/m.3583 type:complete len:369 (-) Transcript_1312:55-1161(-)